MGTTREERDQLLDRHVDRALRLLRKCLISYKKFDPLPLARKAAKESLTLPWRVEARKCARCQRLIPLTICASENRWTYAETVAEVMKRLEWESVVAPILIDADPKAVDRASMLHFDRETRIKLQAAMSKYRLAITSVQQATS